MPICLTLFSTGAAAASPREPGADGPAEHRPGAISRDRRAARPRKGWGQVPAKGSDRRRAPSAACTGRPVRRRRSGSACVRVVGWVGGLFATPPTRPLPFRSSPPPPPTSYCLPFDEHSRLTTAAGRAAWRGLHETAAGSRVSHVQLHLVGTPAFEGAAASVSKNTAAPLFARDRRGASLPNPVLEEGGL